MNDLAERTGGACELVSPMENMAERIHRHFKRIGTPCSGSNEIVWPAQPLCVFPESLPPVYDGDTINLFSWFPERPAGEVSLKVSLPDGSTQVFVATATNAAESGETAIVSRMVAALRLRETTDNKVGQDLAIKYQLVSKWTNYLAVVEREERNKADTLPELHKVPQMLAAGYGGTGSVAYYSASQSVVTENTIKYYRTMAPAPPSDNYDMPCFMRESSDAGVTSIKRNSKSLCSINQPDGDSNYFLDEKWLWDDDSIDVFIENLDAILKAGSIPKTIHLPLLPAVIEAVLALIVNEGVDEKTVVTVFLHLLAGSAVGDKLSRQAKRVIAKEYKTLKADNQVLELISERLKGEDIESIFDEDQYDLPTFLRKAGSTGAAP